MLLLKTKNIFLFFKKVVNILAKSDNYILGQLWKNAKYFFYSAKGNLDIAGAKGWNKFYHWIKSKISDMPGEIHQSGSVRGTEISLMKINWK